MHRAGNGSVRHAGRNDEDNARSIFRMAVDLCPVAVDVIGSDPGNLVNGAAPSTVDAIVAAPYVPGSAVRRWLLSLLYSFPVYDAGKRDHDVFRSPAYHGGLRGGVPP